MKIKSGDRILNLSSPWSGKVRSISDFWAVIDLCNSERVTVRRSNIKYNDDLKTWEVVNGK